MFPLKNPFGFVPVYLVAFAVNADVVPELGHWAFAARTRDALRFGASCMASTLIVLGQKSQCSLYLLQWSEC